MVALNNFNEQESPRENRYYLEPLNYGELVDRTIRIFRENLKYLLHTTFNVYSPFIVSTIIFFILRIANNENQETVNLMNNINNIISSLCTFTLIARVTTMVTEIYNGNPVDMETIKIKSSGFYWQILKTGFFYGIAVGSLVFLSILVGGIILGVLGSALNVVGFIIGILIIVLLLLGAIRWAFANSLSVYLVPLEGISGNDAFKRSSQLFYSNKESMYKVMLIPIIIQVLLFLVFLAPTVFMVILVTLSHQYFQSAILIMGILTLIMVAMSIFLNSLPIIAMTVVYYDIKIRTEGFDIEREMNNKAMM